MAETARKIKYPTEAHREADELLAQIGEEQAKLSNLVKIYDAEVNELNSRYKVAVTQKRLDLELFERRLKKLMKLHRYRFFDGEDRLNLAHGALLFAIEDRVKRAKAVLKRLEESGAEDLAYIVTKQVNWDYLETWTDERLIEVGTERKKEEKFSYEIFGGAAC